MSVSSMTVGINVRDLERSIDFYERFVGLSAMDRTGLDGGSVEVPMRHDDDVALILVDASQAENEQTRGAPWGRLMFHVSDIQAVLADLSAAGLNASKLVTVREIRNCFCLHERSGWKYGGAVAVRPAARAGC